MEIRCRTDVAGILRDRAAIVVGAVLGEPPDEWLMASRCYVSADSVKADQMHVIADKEVPMGV